MNRQVIKKSSGNIFADLGLPDAPGLLVKAELVAKIGRIIKARNLTQAGAAQILGIDQPKISAMMRGHYEGYSVDRLIRFLTSLDQDIKISVRNKRGTEPVVAVV